MSGETAAWWSRGGGGERTHRRHGVELGLAGVLELVRGVKDPLALRPELLEAAVPPFHEQDLLDRVLDARRVGALLAELLVRDAALGQVGELELEVGVLR